MGLPFHGVGTNRGRGAAIDMKRDYLLPDGWYKVGEEVTLRNDFIASFCWEIAIPGDPSKIETANA